MLSTQHQRQRSETPKIYIIGIMSSNVLGFLVQLLVLVHLCGLMIYHIGHACLLSRTQCKTSPKIEFIVINRHRIIVK